MSKVFRKIQLYLRIVGILWASVFSERILLASIFESEVQLEASINKIIEKFDTDAFAVLNLKPKKSYIRLPGSAQKVLQIAYDTENRIIFASLEVELHASDLDLIKPAIPIITNYLAKFTSTKASWKYVKKPFRANQQSTPGEIFKTQSDTTFEVLKSQIEDLKKDRTEIENRMGSLANEPTWIKSFTQTITSMLSAMGSKNDDKPSKQEKLIEGLLSNLDQQQKNSMEINSFSDIPDFASRKPLIAFVMLVLISSALVFLYLGISIIVTRPKQHGELITSLNTLSSSFQDADKKSGAAMPMSPAAFSGGDTVSRAASAIPTDNSIVNDLFTNLPDVGLCALLADCYWSKFDQFACFIWKRIPIKRRELLLGQLDFLKEYSNFFITQAEKYLGYEQEAYYLYPLPINALNKDDLSDFVRSYPESYVHLPTMRNEALNFSVSDRLKISATASSMTKDEVALLIPKTKSPHRVLKKNLVLEIKSAEDEEQILGMDNLSLAQKESIPTLGWAIDLPKENLEKILANFSAQALASVWVAPPQVLSHFESCLPEKKRMLVLEYRNSVKPSRSGDLFLAIHRMIIADLKAIGREIREDTGLNQRKGSVLDASA